MGDVRFRLFGPMEVAIGGDPVALPGAAERGLLAVLLLSPGRTVSATALIDRLWSESTLPADPVNALQLRVSKLRRALAVHGSDLVTRVDAGYRADVDPEQVDVHRFTQLVRRGRELAATGAAEESVQVYDEALGLWQGEPLADFAGNSWATVESVRLEELRLAAIAERAEAALALGRHARVAADLEPVVAADPHHEGLAALLMTALYGSGRQGDALEVFQRTRAALDEQLGLEPSATLRALHQRILEQDPQLSTAVPVSASTAAPAAPAAPAPLPPAVQLVGREHDLDRIAELVGAHRLVTLIGPGGAGKTSLAYAAAHRLGDGYDDGVRVAQLAAVSRPSDVPLAVADAVGVPLDGADPTAGVRDRLVAYLANRRLLLVVDNCEHVVDAAAQLVDGVLAAAAGVTVLATSREALAVPGEVQLGVAPLPVPPPDTPAEHVLDHAAAELFVARARAVRPDLALDGEDLAAVAAICRHLDGIPLALELAAARVSSLSPADLADRLQDRFAVLTTGPRTADARQRTLRGAVEWSHALLSAAEQEAFRRLAVFEGGWTLDAAEAVVPGGGIRAGDVLDLLHQLVGRSMVVADAGRPTRYRMLETLRQYAVERLAEAGETDEVAARHAAYFSALAEDAEGALRGRRQRETFARLRADHANLRAAIAWLANRPSSVDDALRLAGALGLYWHLGRHVEGRDVLRQLVTLPASATDARARALQAVSLVERPRACLVHPSPRCAETAAESLRLFETAGDARRAALSRVLLAVESLDGSDPDAFTRLLADAEDQFTREDDEWGHGVVAFVRLQHYLLTGDEARARATGRAAAATFRALDDPWGLSAVLYHLGWGLREFGRYADCVPVLEQAIEVALSAGMYNTAQWALADLGVAYVHLGQHDAAEQCFVRAAGASREIGDTAGVVLAAHGRALQARLAGDIPRARALYAEALDGLQRLGTPLWAGEALAGLAACDLAEGSIDAAQERYEEVLRVGERIAAPALRATAYEGLARVAIVRGDGDEAQRLLEEAARLRVTASRPAAPHDAAALAAVSRELPAR